jgi:hypothetical protein
MVADRPGKTTSYAIDHLQPRGVLLSVGIMRYTRSRATVVPRTRVQGKVGDAITG